MAAPDNIVNQIEGGLISSTSWNLGEEVKFDAAAVLSSDWTGHPILTFNPAPNLETRSIDRPGESCRDTGEISLCPAGSEVANALFDAVGSRVRLFPLTPDWVNAAADS